MDWIEASVFFLGSERGCRQPRYELDARCPRDEAHSVDRDLPRVFARWRDLFLWLLLLLLITLKAHSGGRGDCAVFLLLASRV